MATKTNHERAGTRVNSLRPRDDEHRIAITAFPTAVALVTVLLALAMAGASEGQKLMPKPRPSTVPTEVKPKPRPQPKALPPAAAAEKPAPPPVLLVTADADCRVAVDGQERLTLRADQVATLSVAPGEHLIQAYPLAVEGPSWDGVVRVPETGQVVARIELAEVVDEWKNIRFVTRGGIVEDRKTGLMWAGTVLRDLEWKEAAKRCEASTRGGHSDWRLPVLNELSSLYWPDHPEPRKSTNDPGMFSPVHVVPVLVYEPFEHNRMSSLWVHDGGPKRPFRCSFESEFDCERSRGSKLGDAICVRVHSDGGQRTQEPSAGGQVPDRTQSWPEAWSQRE